MLKRISTLAIAMVLSCSLWGNNQSGKFTFDVASTNSPSVHIGELYTVDQNLPRPR